MKSNVLTFATCQAQNTVPVSRALAHYLTGKLDRPVRFLENIDWRLAYRLIAKGVIDIGWICGHPYTQLVDIQDAPIRLLAAPVITGERYGGRPIYFSDVVVRRDSPFHRFADLRCASWAYNEPGSHSGYHITRYYLARMGHDGRYFGRVVESGEHAQSLRMVLTGGVDASAIDSTVLEWEAERDPTLTDRLRVIASFGPSPSPPLVVSRHLPESLQRDIREQLAELASTTEGRAILAEGRLDIFAGVTDADYDIIRAMDQQSAGVALLHNQTAVNSCSSEAKSDPRS